MRPIRTAEKQLLRELLSIARLEYDIENLLVIDLKDGGMGSLGIGTNYKERQFGSEVAKTEFQDDDGVLVSCTLNLDSNGDLYELDVWKVDFSETSALPHD